MARRLLMLLVPLVLVAGACSSSGPSKEARNGPPKRTTSTSSTVPATGAPSSSAPGSTAPSTPGSSSGGTTAPAGGIALTGSKGSGSVAYTLEPSRSEFCYQITVKGIGTPTSASLRRGEPGASGDVVLELRPPAADATVDNCAAGDSLLIDELQSSPRRFFIDVRAGSTVLRAQLR